MHYVQCNLCIVATPWDLVSWLQYRDGLIMQVNFYRISLSVTQPGGYNREVT